MHRAGKLVSRVAVYTHKDPAQWLRLLAGERIHNSEALELYAFDRAVITGLASRLERRMTFALSVNDRELYLSLAAATVSGVIQRVRP